MGTINEIAISLIVPFIMKPVFRHFGVWVQFTCGGRGAKILKEKPSAVTLPLVTEK
jgi:hypothetical protein